MENRSKSCRKDKSQTLDRVQTDQVVEELCRKYKLKIKIFPVNKIPEAITWAERGFIAIHENYQSRRKKTYHIISSDKEKLLFLCTELSIPQESVRSSDFFKFWHTSWAP